MYNDYNFVGMNFVWWIIWMGLLFWIFFTPYSILGERRRKNAPLDILKLRLANGQITKEIYDEYKIILETN